MTSLETPSRLAEKALHALVEIRERMLGHPHLVISEGDVTALKAVWTRIDAIAFPTLRETIAGVLRAEILKATQELEDMASGKPLKYETADQRGLLHFVADVERRISEGAWHLFLNNGYDDGPDVPRQLLADGFDINTVHRWCGTLLAHAIAQANRHADKLKNEVRFIEMLIDFGAKIAAEDVAVAEVPAVRGLLEAAYLKQAVSAPGGA